ncbi:MAG: TIM44-like domain-containing protein [Aquabacterium sp.]|uniref:Tim44 domain-containing protein n=1 Tax=Aquabacterium sp. TaxID=1872578 RepID=UPI00271D9AE4|nr:TIM44-like domain-containing protein [Aquabacterium sp.]MDO9002290.1 TIM44-like domain-containing protein [Aquabacterium sp.]
MKKILMSVCMAVLSLTFVAQHVEAKRLGGGSSSGMKRQMPAQNSPAQQQAAKPTAAPGAQAVPPTVAPKRNWMGPIAGLAAGLGIAALMSHLGMGAALGNMITMALLAVAAFFVIRWLMRRFGNQSPVPATSGGPRLSPNDFARVPTPPTQPMSRDMSVAPQGVSSDGMLSGPSFASVAAGSASSLPPGFDAPAFERIAKLIFIRMQAANDASNLDDLRQFSTPEMFAVFKLELQDRGNAPQVTDVVQLNAEVLDFADEADRQIVSVRFHGLIREEKDAPTTTFDEIWHLAKPKAGSGEWAIAGIAQTA